MRADGRIEFPRTFLPVYCLLSPRLPVPFSFVPTYFFALQIPFLTSFPSFSYIFSVFFIQHWITFRIFEYPSKILPFDNTKQKSGFCFVLCSLIRIFAPLNIICQTMNTQVMTQQIVEYFKTQPVLKAWLFGSYSRGEQRADSDVDILILPDKSQHFSLFTLSEIYEDLKELLGREVDVITVGGLMPFARESADRDKILIYERAA